MIENASEQFVPIGWEVMRFGGFAHLQKGVSYQTSNYCAEDSGYIFINLKCIKKHGGFSSKGIKHFEGFVPSIQKLNVNDLLIANTDLTRDGDIVGCPILIPKLDAHKEITFSMDLSKVNLNENTANKVLIYYILATPKVRRFMQCHSNGSTVLHLQTTVLPELPFILPKSLNEQDKVAEILSATDDAIEKTQLRIEKLKRIKQGLMQDLFHYGIDENGKIRSEATHRFKDSPLGRIPEKWDVFELKQWCDVTSSKRIYFDEYVEEGIPFYRSKEIIQKVNGETITETINISFKKYETIKKHFGVPGENDILITSVGTLGICYLVKDGDLFYFKDGNLIWLRDLSNMIRADFLIHFLPYLIARQIDSLTIGTSQGAFTIEKIKKMLILRPREPAEQSHIASILSSADDAIEKEECYRLKLLAIKRGLIDDLLSGKVRVNHLINRN